MRIAYVDSSAIVALEFGQAAAGDVAALLDQRQARAARRLGFDVRPQRGGKQRD